MKRLALLGALICLYNVNLAGQSKNSSATVGYSLGGLCSQVNQDPTAYCPTASWTVYDASGTTVDYSGYGSSYGHDEYGVLRASATAEVQSNFPSAAGAASTSAEGQAIFGDSLTFSGLKGGGPYYLMVSLTVTGSVGGGFITPSAATLAGSAQLIDNVNSSDCVVQNTNANGAIRQSCSTKMQIFPGDIVGFSGLFGVSIGAVTPNSTSASNQLIQADFSSKKNYGATYALSVVYANGKKVPGATIIAASGTQYPTH